MKLIGLMTFHLCALTASALCSSMLVPGHFDERDESARLSIAFNPPVQAVPIDIPLTCSR
jgi:hypothetical protein